MKKYLNQFKDGTKLMFKEFFNKETNKKQRANMWTFSRLVMSFIIPILMIIGAITASLPILGVATGITAFGGITDILDGRSARKHKSFSEYGKLLDQVVDKIFNAVIAISLSIFNPAFLITILGEGLIAGTNLMYKNKYKDLKITSTFIGKAKQVPLCLSLVLGFFSILIPGFPNITNHMIATTLLFQLAATTSYINQNNKEIRTIKKKEIQNYIEELNTEENKNENVKVLEKENGKLDIETKLTKKEQYERLRDVLKNIVSMNNKVDTISENEKGIQKIKK